jgi:hypothetical protein
MSTAAYPGQIRLDNEVSAKIIARAWLDPQFKAKLIADPIAVLRDAGVVIPDGMRFEVKELPESGVAGGESGPLYHLVLPPKPSDQQIGGGPIDDVVAASCSGTWHNLCGCS